MEEVKVSEDALRLFNGNYGQYETATLKNNPYNSIDKNKILDQIELQKFSS